MIRLWEPPPGLSGGISATLDDAMAAFRGEMGRAGMIDAAPAPSHGPNGGVPISLDEAKAAFRRGLGKRALVQSRLRS